MPWRLVLLVLAAYVMRDLWGVRAWSSESALWTSSVSASPRSFRAQSNYLKAHFSQGRP